MNTRKIAIKTLGVLMVAAMLLAFLPAGEVMAQTTWTVDCVTSCDQTHIQNAIYGAAAGDTIEVSGGPYIFTSGITVDIAVTLKGVGKPLVQVSGTGNRITMSGAGSTLEGFHIQKTDKVGEQNIISVTNADVTIKNNKIWGAYEFGDPQVSRAIVNNSGIQNLTITGNEIFDLRQPAYINGGTGEISGNLVYRTRGWVIQNENFQFDNNSWGSGADANIFDIVFLDTVASEFYTDIVAISEANNMAVVEDQRVSPAVLSVVYVDASAPADGNGGAAQPYQTIQEGVDRVVEGGTVYVAAGTYVEQLFINKSITLISVEEHGAVIQAPGSMTGYILPESSHPIYAVVLALGGTLDGTAVTGGDPITFNMSGFEIDAQEYNVRRTSGVLLHSVGGQVSNNLIGNFGLDTETFGIQVYGESNVTIQGNEISGFGRSGIGVNGTIDSSAGPHPYAEIIENTVTKTGTTVWAANGIQIGYFATGKIVNNTVSSSIWEGENWAASGIILPGVSDVEVVGNTVTNCDYGISITGYEDWDGNYLPTSGVIITDNTILNNKYGIGIQGAVSDTVILRNIIEDNTLVGVVSFDYNPAGWTGGGIPTGTVMQFNQVTGSTYPVYVYPLETANEPAPEGFVMNASPNWWGSILGPMGPITGDVDYSPWCGDAECSFLVPDEEIVLEGEINETIVINNPGMTILLMDGTTINAGGPCFEVNASQTKIYTESNLGAVCYPGSNGVVVADGVDQFELIGLEIDGTGMNAGNGVHFEGAVSNVWLIDNFIHDIVADEEDDTTGHGVYFAAGLGGTVNSIQGNLFLDNAGNGIEAGTHPIDAQYNAWGHVEGAEEGDGASVNVNWTNWTHADLYLESSGTVYADQVVLGDQIVYTVYGSLANVSGVEIDLTHSPEPLGYVPESFEYNSDLFDEAGVNYTPFQVSMYGYQWVAEGSGPVEGITTTEPTWLFRVAFTGLETCKTCSAGFEGLAEFAFAHTQIDGGPTNNIYPAALVGVDPIEVIELPVLSQEGLDDPLTAGIERYFTVRLENPETGGVFDPVLVNFLIADAALDDIYSFECFDQTHGWLELLDEDGEGNLVGVWGPSEGFPLTAPYDETTLCRVTFRNPGAYAVEITLVDLDTDWELARLDLPVVVNAGDFTVTGTVSMQGRTARSGVPMTLTSDIYAAVEANSGPTMLGNLVFSAMNGGTYQITTLQPRYLNIHEELGLSIYLSGDVDLPPLHLYGGNAVQDNIIDIFDASYVGTEYGWTGNTALQDADVNFDGKVNIQDLALVGGNFDLTSAEAYGEWISPVLEGVSPAPGAVVLGAGQNFVWIVDALDMDDNLYKLEIDHSFEGTFPEFSVYASEENPYGTEADRQEFEVDYGVFVTYNAAQQAWTFDFGNTFTDVFIGHGGITFYVVLEDTAGNQWGTMYGTTPENTFAYTITRE